MTEFIIINKRTIARKLRKLGLTALVLGGIFGAYTIAHPLVSGFVSTYRNYRVSSSLESMVKDYRYSEAKRILQELPKGYPEDKAIEFESQLKSIHPDTIYAKLDSFELPERMRILKILRDEYTSLNQEKPEIKEAYIQSQLSHLTEQLKVSETDISEILKGLDTLLEENPLKPEKNAQEEAVSSKNFDSFFNAQVFYIQNFKDSKGDGYSEIEQLINKSIEVILGKYTHLHSHPGDSPEEKSFVPLVLEAYGENIKKLLGINNPDSTKLRYLSSIKKLEQKFNYKVKGLEVDQLIVEYASK